MRRFRSLFILNRCCFHRPEAASEWRSRKLPRSIGVALTVVALTAASPAHAIGKDGAAGSGKRSRSRHNLGAMNFGELNRGVLGKWAEFGTSMMRLGTDVFHNHVRGLNRAFSLGLDRSRVKHHSERTRRGDRRPNEQNRTSPTVMDPIGFANHGMRHMQNMTLLGLRNVSEISSAVLQLTRLPFMPLAGSAPEKNPFKHIDPLYWPVQLAHYSIDFAQRLAMQADLPGAEARQMIEHRRAGRPPAMAYRYRTVVRGDKMASPMAYDLMEIKGPRKPRGKISSELAKKIAGQQRLRDPNAKPLIVVDPDAGHQTIGASKLDSIVGRALEKGMPVYVFAARRDAVPGQTLDQTSQMLLDCISKVAKKHGVSLGDVQLQGHCQGGWNSLYTVAQDAVAANGKAALVTAGAPSSFWAGKIGSKRMRISSLPFGGKWFLRLVGDLTGDVNPGSMLAAGFQNDSLTTHLTWPNDVFRGVNPLERHLTFQQWWQDANKHATSQLHKIVGDLFIENLPEQGLFQLNGKRIDLAKVKRPMVVLASHGDNITSPIQALGWVNEIYGSSAEMVRQGKTIVYVNHDKIGHLGIFSSSSMGNREHRAIARTLDRVNHLPPGLWEMVINDVKNPDGSVDIKVSYERRRVRDIRALGDLKHHNAFNAMAQFSRANDAAYGLLSPWVRFANNPIAETLWQHIIDPSHVQSALRSEMNPITWPVRWLANYVRSHRIDIGKNNPFKMMEDNNAVWSADAIKAYQNIRDAGNEAAFWALLDNPITGMLLPEPAASVEAREKRHKGWERSKRRARKTNAKLRKQAGEGGPDVAVARVMAAVLRGKNISGKTIDRATAAMSEALQNISPDALVDVFKHQSKIVGASGLRNAIEQLPTLVPGAANREKLLAIVNAAFKDAELGSKQRETLAHINGVLGADGNPGNGLVEQ